MKQAPNTPPIWMDNMAEWLRRAERMRMAIDIELARMVAENAAVKIRREEK